MTCVSSSLKPEMNMFSLIVILSSKGGFYADNVHCFHSLLVGKIFIRGGWLLLRNGMVCVFICVFICEMFQSYVAHREFSFEYSAFCCSGRVSGIEKFKRQR